MNLTLRLFTHPSCPRCGLAVQSAWALQQQHPDRFELRTVSLVNKEGLDEAFAEKIKTIPTLILSREGEELERIVGAPQNGELEHALVKALAANDAAKEAM